MAKRLELLSELVPQPGAIVLLVNPNNENAERVVREGQDAARAKGVQLTILKAATEREVNTAFAALSAWPLPFDLRARISSRCEQGSPRSHSSALVAGSCGAPYRRRTIGCCSTPLRWRKQGFEPSVSLERLVEICWGRSDMSPSTRIAIRFTAC